MNDIVQLKITLQQTKPPIWRRILVDKSTTFSVLHSIILASMGWEGGHMYEFDVNDYKIGSIEDAGEFANELLDASKETIDSQFSKPKESFGYLYDFGDSWDHHITIEKYLPREENKIYPICLEGERNCPPEDCGGVYGFYDLLVAIKDKKHPDHEDMIEWIGEDYDPEFFDKKSINEYLVYFSKKSTKKGRRM